MSIPPSSLALLPGLAWIPGVNAVEVQQASQLSIDSKTLGYAVFGYGVYHHEEKKIDSCFNSAGIPP